MVDFCLVYIKVQHAKPCQMLLRDTKKCHILFALNHFWLTRPLCEHVQCLNAGFWIQIAMMWYKLFCSCTYRLLAIQRNSFSNNCEIIGSKLVGLYVYVPHITSAGLSDLGITIICATFDVSGKKHSTEYRTKFFFTNLIRLEFTLL